MVIGARRVGGGCGSRVGVWAQIDASLWPWVRWGGVAVAEIGQVVELERDNMLRMQNASDTRYQVHTAAAV